MVEIVLGFLSSGGGKADRSLGGYINHTLKMKKRHFSEKVLGGCLATFTIIILGCMFFNRVGRLHMYSGALRVVSMT